MKPLSVMVKEIIECQEHVENGGKVLYMGLEEKPLSPKVFDTLLSNIEISKKDRKEIIKVLPNIRKSLNIIMGVDDNIDSDGISLHGKLATPENIGNALTAGFCFLPEFAGKSKHMVDGVRVPNPPKYEPSTLNGNDSTLVYLDTEGLGRETKEKFKELELLSFACRDFDEFREKYSVATPDEKQQLVSRNNNMLNGLYAKSNLSTFARIFADLQPHQIDLLDKIEEDKIRENLTGERSMSQEEIRLSLDRVFNPVNIDTVATDGGYKPIDIIVLGDSIGTLTIGKGKSRHQDKIDRHGFHGLFRPDIHLGHMYDERRQSSGLYPKVEKFNAPRRHHTTKEIHINHLEHVRGLRSNKKKRY